MAIRFVCSACRQPIEVDDEMANQAVTCPYCRTAVDVPAASTLDAGATTPPEPADYAGPEEPLPRKTSPLGWIALACVVVFVLSSAYFILVLASLMKGLDPNAMPPEELQQIVEERMKSKPGIQIIGYLGACVVPAIGIVCAIVALAKRNRPRWPAIVALSLLGLFAVLMCLGVAIKMSAALSQAGP